MAVEPERRIEVEDGFAHADARPSNDVPTMRMTSPCEPTSTGSRCTGVTVFPSLEVMERLVAMGTLDGMQSALGQLDAVLALGPAGPAT